jgi:hypothetical protein
MSVLSPTRPRPLRYLPLLAGLPLLLAITPWTRSEAAPKSASCSAAFAAIESEVVSAGKLASGGAVTRHQEVTQSFAEAIRLLKKAKFDTYLVEGASRRYGELLPGFKRIYGSPGAGPLLEMDLVNLKFALQRGEIRLPASELAELEKHFTAIQKAVGEPTSIDALAENVFALKADGLYRALRLVKDGRDVLSSRELKAARDSFDEAAARTNGNSGPAPYIPAGAKPPKNGPKIIRADERRGDLFEAWAIVSRRAGDQTPKSVVELKKLLKSKTEAAVDFLERESTGVDLADLKLTAAARKKIEKAVNDATADEERLWLDTILEGEVRQKGPATAETVQAWVWKGETLAYLVHISAPAEQLGSRGRIHSQVLLGADLKKIDVQKWIAEFDD